MPKNTCKYNSACEADIHTNMPHVFVLHVARCKVCQEKLPKELLESLEPNLSKNIANIVKREAEAKKQVPPVQEVKVKEEVAPQTKPPEPSSPADGLDLETRGLPSIQGLAKTVDAVKADMGKISAKVETEIKGMSKEFKTLAGQIDLLLGIGGAVPTGSAKKTGSEDESIETGGKEPVTDTPVLVPEVKTGPAPAAGGERITMPDELVREAEDIRKDLGGDNRPPLETGRTEERVSMREGEVKEEPVIPPVRKDEPVIPPASPSAAGAPDLESPGQVQAFEQYISQQKQKLGMGEEAGAEVPGEKGKIGLLTDAKDIATQVRGIIEAIKGGKGGEGSSLPKTTEELASKVLMQVVTGAVSKKDPIEYLTAGMELSNKNLANSIKLFTGLTGKGPIAPSMEDIGAVVRKEIQKMITPTTTEHLPTEETGE